MLHKLSERARREQGFTLIELLVVILIIGILAAIAIPSFLSQRTKAQDASAKVGALSARTAMETYATDNTPTGSYVNATVAALQNIEPTLANVTLTVDRANGTGYRVTATSSGGNTFSVDREGGTITRPCTVAGTGGCPAAGW